MKREGVLVIRLKRAYEPAEAGDGARFLVERLWPRGVRKTALQLDGWLKDAAPSAELRMWFHHDPERWLEFRRRYFAELQTNASAWQPIVDAANSGPVTLVYGSRDPDHNSAIVLREFLLDRTKKF